MDKNELLKYLICEIDLVMHDKDYRFENEDGTWYSRESCRNLTNEEVFEELKGELRQLAKIEDDFADLEAKLTKSEKLNKRLQQIVDKLRDKEFAGETLVNAVNAVYEPLYQNKYDEVEQLKQQLAEKDAEFQSLKLLLDAVDHYKQYQKDANLVILNPENCYADGYKVILKTDNQTAIAELEKVKEQIDCEMAIREGDMCEQTEDVCVLVADFINQQIKSLKGEK